MFFLQMSGFPGSGKSTLAREIGKATNAVIVDHDIVKSALMESLNKVDLDDKKLGKVSYNIDWSFIDFILLQGHSVILDSPCLYTEMVERGLELSKKHNVKFKYVECILEDINEINTRLKSRKRMRSQIQQVHSEESFMKWIKNSKKPSNINTLTIDSSQPLDSYINGVIKYLEEE
ncbi:AAA family ATPase [Chengkuizengella axinellae]|uniref:AAA family ATPase n=1 Tax=Chengkuizengella axinellae TaxID=3064388 RepID=A0ABT9IZZ9_9BACL|nr:AAA family ATPase [Chengkuizengella sp. 2205SS18-9]MDP5274936.1 AAA family ATPase [Chengkuizengella sp. 2205SS18-9]